MASDRKFARPDGIRSIGKFEITRRTLVSRAVQIGVGVAALTGGVVGFTPTAEAVSCIPGSSHRVTCSQACVGACTTAESECVYKIAGYTGYKYPFICFCYNYCSPARAVCTCNTTGGYGTGTSCCKYC